MRDQDQAKVEITDACCAAINEWLRSTRGAALMGAGAEAKKVGEGFVEVRGHVKSVSGPIYYSVRIRHAM